VTRALHTVTGVEEEEMVPGFSAGNKGLDLLQDVFLRRARMPVSALRLKKDGNIAVLVAITL
jgi:hypothetical protein